MVDKIFVYDETETLPYHNLATEEYLMESVAAGAVTLYLWQNRHTVVAGRNQNPWRECRVAELEADGGYFVRRLSGGGAVFHDIGNLNFTFLARTEDYDVERQLEVILRAVQALGVSAEKSGRNDITVDGRKFSGNAFYKSGGCAYHHGTLMVCADIASLSKYLSVSPEKLKAKGVQSVRSRVANLSEFAPAVTVPALKKALMAAFAEVYGLEPTPISCDKINSARVAELTRKFSSWQWNFGAKIPLTCELSRRFGWGELQIQLYAEGGLVKEAKAYSDAMNAGVIELLAPPLCGVRFAPEELRAALNPLFLSAVADDERQIIADAQSLLREDFP